MSISGISILTNNPRVVNRILHLRSPDPKVQRVLEKLQMEIQNSQNLTVRDIAETESFYTQINGNWHIGDCPLEGKGNGIVIYSDGTIEEGDFFNGKLHGQGARINHIGRHEGRFLAGILLGRFPRVYSSLDVSVKLPDRTQSSTDAETKAVQYHKQFIQSILHNLSLDPSPENEEKISKALIEAAQELKEKTETILGAKSKRGMYPAVVGPSTVVQRKIGSESISIANVISTVEEEGITLIASRAPANFDDTDAIVNGLQPGDLIINLQEEGEQKNASLYAQIEGIGQTIPEDGVILSDDPSKKIFLYQYPLWKDGSAIPLKELDRLVVFIEKLVESRQKADLPVRVWVHCHAGIGRTGTLITALRLKRHIANSSDCAENCLKTLHQALVGLILDGRSKRSASFVHTEPQFRLLFEYTAKLIGDRSSQVKQR